MRSLRIGWLIAKAAFWTVTFEAACLISAECRAIKADCLEKGEDIDPIAKIETEMHKLLY